MKKISLLSISYDQNIANQKIADARNRQIAYSKYFKKVNVIILSTRSHKLKKSVNGNLAIIPTNSVFKAFSIIDSISLAHQKHRKTPFDLITADDPLFTGLVGVILKFILKLPLNLQLHIDYFLEPHWLKERWQNRFLVPLIKFNLNQADTIRVVNEGAKKKLSKLFPHRKNSTFVAPITTNLKYFWKNPTRKKNPTKLISVGRLVKQKNFPLLIHAFRLALDAQPKLTLTIIGDGPERHTLEQLINQLNLQSKVKLLGLLSHDKVRYRLHHSDIFILTSNHEGFGLVYLEALAAGLPVVTTKISTAGEIIINNTTGIITQNNPNQLAKQIVKLAKSPSTANKLARQGQAHIKKNFSSSQLLKDWINGLYQTVVNHES